MSPPSMISNLIHIELAHINTNHPDFVGGERAEREALRAEEAAEAAIVHHSSGQEGTTPHALYMFFFMQRAAVPSWRVHALSTSRLDARCVLCIV